MTIYHKIQIEKVYFIYLNWVSYWNKQIYILLYYFISIQEKADVRQNYPLKGALLTKNNQLTYALYNKQHICLQNCLLRNINAIKHT
jgi:hypothetical protein